MARPAELERGVGAHIVTKLGKKHNYPVKLTFRITNNKAEYEALLARMLVAKLLGAKEVELKADSQVLINQVLEEFAIKGEKLKKYLQRVYEESDLFCYFHI